jgi:hypothetical protein
MRTRLVTRVGREWMPGLALGLLAAVPLRAQDVDANLGNSGGWQRYDWLAPAPPTTVANGKLTTTTAPSATGDPFTVVSQGAIAQENVGVTYTRALEPGIDLSYESNAVTLNESSGSYLAPTDGTPDDLSHGQKASLQFQPAAPLTLAGNVHTSTDDAGSPESAWETHGTGLSAEGHLPGDSVLNFSLNDDTTTTGLVATPASTSADDSYDGQWKQPLGKLPLTAVLKGHYEETTSDGALATRLPSMEQSLIWKPIGDTTLQMGLRQQHYQDFPGITNQFNETLFADWAQTIMPDVTWHSYAEVLNSNGTRPVAPAAVTTSTSGVNGTPQSADPTNDPLNTSFNDETITFSTGPSFQLDRDLSASIEYSNKVDRNPAPGDAGQEQRVSVSLKGTF